MQCTCLDTRMHLVFKNLWAQVCHRVVVAHAVEDDWEHEHAESCVNQCLIVEMTFLGETPITFKIGTNDLI